MTNPMRFEEQRLSTFENWPSNAKVEARKIAKAGFFHTGQNTEVKCSWCGCVLSDWSYGDQVMAKHRAASPDCPFIRNTSDNVPMIANSGGGNLGSEQQNDNDHETNDENDMPPNVQRSSYSPDRSEALKCESARLATYQDWPLGFIHPRSLAKTGFVYTGRADCVRCVFCGEYVGDWDRSDVPEREHRNLFPHCPFVRGMEVGNVPFDPSTTTFVDRASRISTVPESPTTSSSSSSSSSSNGLSSSSSSPGGYDVVGIRNQDKARSRGSALNGNNVLILNKESNDPSDEAIGIIRHSDPVHPKYATVESRLRTYAEWPPALKQQPKELSEAGFYYNGLGDQVKCFSCDGGLRNWRSDDDPWTEHGRWFPKCGYVRLVKGDEFIQNALAEKPTSDAISASLPPTQSLSPENEEALTRLMSTSIVHEVLSMGIDPSKVKSALMKKMSETGTGFTSTSQLMDAAFGVHRPRTPTDDESPNTSTTSASSNICNETEEAPGSNKETASSSSGNPDNSTNSEGSPSDTLTSFNSLSCSSSKDDVNAVRSNRKDENGGADLQSENRRLKEQRTCKICMDNEIGVVFLPCGHLICCLRCAPALRDCPLCRQPIHGAVKTYMS